MGLIVGAWRSAKDAHVQAMAQYTVWDEPDANWRTGLLEHGETTSAAYEAVKSEMR